MKKYVLLSVLITLSVLSFGREFYDTLKFNPLERYSYVEPFGYEKQITESLKLLGADSIMQGLTGLLKGIKMMNETEHYDRVSDYSAIELTDLLELIGSGEINKKQEKLLISFIEEEYLGKDNGAIETIDKLLKKDSRSVFLIRLKVLDGYLKNNYETVDKYLEKWLQLESGIPCW